MAHGLSWHSLLRHFGSERMSSLAGGMCWTAAILVQTCEPGVQWACGVHLCCEGRVGWSVSSVEVWAWYKNGLLCAWWAVQLCHRQPVAVWNTVNLLLKSGWVFGPDSTLALFHTGCSSLVMPQSCTGWAGEPALRVEGGVWTTLGCVDQTLYRELMDWHPHWGASMMQIAACNDEIIHCQII